MQFHNSPHRICRKIRYFGEHIWKICGKIHYFHRNLSDIYVKYGILKLKVSKNTKKYSILSRFWDLGWSARRAQRRSETKNEQNEAIFKRNYIMSWTGFENLKSGFRRAEQRQIAENCMKMLKNTIKHANLQFL